jgi:hypothetical protein
MCKKLNHPYNNPNDEKLCFFADPSLQPELFDHVLVQSARQKAPFYLRFRPVMRFW